MHPRVFGRTKNVEMLCIRNTHNPCDTQTHSCTTKGHSTTIYPTHSTKSSSLLCFLVEREDKVTQTLPFREKVTVVPLGVHARRFLRAELISEIGDWTVSSSTCSTEFTFNLPVRTSRERHAEPRLGGRCFTRCGIRSLLLR